MAPDDDELKNLKEMNNELVQKVQYWKMTAAQRESEKVEMLKEINELRFKVIKLKSGGAAEARKIDAEIQCASKEALSHLVQASDAIARAMELAKTYVREKIYQDGMEVPSSRWSNISNTAEKVHRVPPMMIGGQSIQPVVSLSRTLNLSAQRPVARSPNSTRNVTMRALPMHMLQDVYIPLTRLDVRDIPNNDEGEEAADESGENMPFEAGMEELVEESQDLTNTGLDSSRRLDVVTEDSEPEEEIITPPSRARVENPLEGPSWLLDAIGARPALEPDSTTHDAAEPRDSPVEPRASPVEPRVSPEQPRVPEETRVSPEAPVFTPTVRRRKRAMPASESPPRQSALLVGGERVLQVLVPKMCLEASPAKRAAPRFDAPSPNGATDSRVIVSEELTRATEARPSFEPSRIPEPEADNEDVRQSLQSDRDSDSGTERFSETRTRRNRKPVTYKKKPLNSEELARAKGAQSSFGPSRKPEPEADNEDSRNSLQSDRDSDSGPERVGETRTRRNRKPVTYKEKPLNRKLRR